jgi:dTDP-4-amino-4,6-dideoxygalactose transaminase
MAMIPLYKPYMPKELPELDNILHSGALAFGQYSRKFENMLVDYFNHDKIIVTNSFNTAISVVISVLDLKHGDEVIASPMACLASTQPYASSGLKIVWADVDNNLGTLDPESVRNKITSKTKCIIHNHFCGYPGHIDEINAIGREFGITVIDDGIEGFGSEYKGKKIGNCGTDITVFSFTAVRMPNTIDGGAVIFNNKELYLKSLLIRDCGIDRSIFRDDIGEISPNCDIQLIGYSATMSNVNGYIGCLQMENIDNLIFTQRKNATRWDDFFEYQKDINQIEIKKSKPNYWVYGLLANDKRKTILEFREKGFHASGVHINNNIYSVFGDKTILKGVKDFYSRFVAIPSGWWFDLNEFLNV